MKKSIMMAAMLLLAPVTAMADDAAWGDVGGGSFGETPQTTAPAQPAAPAGKTACGQDDPRMQNLIAVLKDVKAGNKVEPLQMSFGTYMGLSDKIRKMLGDNIVISTASCKKQFVFDGELTGKVEMPFPEAMTYINDALRARDATKLKSVFANVKAAPDTLHNILSYSVAKSYPLETGKVLIQAANIQAVRSNDDSMGILLLNLYQALGGTLAQGEKNIVHIMNGQGSGDYAAYLVYSDEGFQVTVGSQVQLYMPKLFETGGLVTDMATAQLSEAYAGLGVSSSLTNEVPKEQ